MKSSLNISRTRVRLLTGLFFLIATLGHAQYDTIFEKGNKLYNAKDYHGALEQYKTISDSGFHSAELYFNMGNAHYKLNQIAPSILNYERALLMDPEDKDIKVNLAYAKNMTIDDIDEMPQTGVSKVVNAVIGKFSYQTWSYIAIGTMLLFVGFFIGYYFSFSQGRKRLLFATSSVWLFISVVSLVFAFQQRKIANERDPAIVFAEETTVKAEPNLGSDEVFRLHEGTKVFILDTMNNWKRIRLADGKVGWLPADELQRVKDFH